jgi:hypothetical protein
MNTVITCFTNQWRNERRYYSCFLHLEVADTGKIWIHHDGINLIIAEKIITYTGLTAAAIENL